MDEDDYRSLILYYGRERFYNSMQNAALEGNFLFSIEYVQFNIKIISFQL